MTKDGPSPTHHWGILKWLGALVWLIYAFHRYLPNLNLPAFKQIVHLGRVFMIRSGLVDLALILWVAGAAYVIGSKLLSYGGARFVSRLECAVFSMALGLAGLSLFTLFLSLVNGLYRSVAYGLLALITIAGLPEIRDLWSNRHAVNVSSLSLTPGEKWLMIATGVYTGVLLLFTLISALGPEIEYDSLVYHLTGPKKYVQAHGLLRIPDIPYTFFPKNVEMLFTLGMLLHNEVTAKLVHYLLGILSWLGVYTFARRFFSRPVGLLAALIFISSPIVLWELRTSHIELGLALYIFLALYALLVWLPSGEKIWWQISLLCIGFSLGIKYHGFFGLFALALIVFGYFRYSVRSGARPSFASAFQFLFLGSLGFLPWALVNGFQAHNPVFPFLNDLFHSPYWSPEQTALAMHEFDKPGYQLQLSNGLRLLNVLWVMVTDPTDVPQGNIGPFILLFVPLLLYQRHFDARIKALLAFSLLYHLLWLFTVRCGRYYIPIQMSLGVVAAYALVSLWSLRNGMKERILAAVTAGVISLMFLFNTPFFERYGTGSRYGASLLWSFPLNLLLGREARDAYMARNVDSYPVICRLNALSDARKVLFCTFTQLPAALYLNADLVYHYSRTAARTIQNKNADEAYRLLRAASVTHVLASPMDQGYFLLTHPDGLFVKKYLRKIYQDNDVLIYELAGREFLGAGAH